MAPLKKKNIESKVLVAEGKEWLAEEESSNDEVKKDECLMVTIGVFVTDQASNNSSTFEADLAKDTSDSKVQNWDSSLLYQVKRFVSYSENENSTMFEYLCLDISKLNQEIINLRNKIESLKNELSNRGKSLSLTSL